MKPIVHTISGAASPYGIHSYLAWLGCSKNAALNEEDLEANDGIRIRDTLTWSGASVGTVGHALMEMHFGQALPVTTEPLIGARIQTASLTHSDLMEERVWVEAARCFRAFREHTPQLDIFGKVIHVEEEFGGIARGEHHRRNEDMSRAVGLIQKGEVFPYTLRLDLGTKMTKRHIERFLKKYPATAGAKEMLKPGVWLVDYKFYAQEKSDLIDAALDRHQYTAYQLAYNAAHPKNPCQGMLQFTVIRRKKVAFLPIVVPPP